MGWSVVADVVVVAHLAYLVFVAVGGILAWRWPRLIWFHVAAVIWSVSILVIGQDCPFTDLQRLAERRAGEPRDDRGFVDRYLEGVLFPERYTTALRLLMGALIVIGWVGCWHRHRHRMARTKVPADPPTPTP
jgi:Protein of Unknown function (DUF2784)